MIASAQDAREQALEAYDSGLARHLDGIERFLTLAVRQTEAARASDAEALAAATSEREVAMSALLEDAAALAPLRQFVEGLDGPWTGHRAWVSAAAARRRIGDCVARILAQDDLTRAALAADTCRRQQERQELEAANATLAAYRRTLAPPSRPATLFDHRG
jgi:hypothetical protein